MQRRRQGRGKHSGHDAEDWWERRARARSGGMRFEEMNGDDKRQRALGIIEQAKERVDSLATTLDLLPVIVERAIFAKSPRRNGRSPWYEDWTAETMKEFEQEWLGPLEAFEEQVSIVGRHAVRVQDWKSAEDIAAEWMRKNGWVDAAVTGRGPDVGIDITATGAVGQVKWFTNGRIGRPDVQRLRGAAPIRSRALFFACADAGAGKPYTQQAKEWARRNKVELHVIDAFGYIRPVDGPDAE